MDALVASLAEFFCASLILPMRMELRPYANSNTHAVAVRRAWTGQLPVLSDAYVTRSTSLGETTLSIGVSLEVLAVAVGADLLSFALNSR
ncbi:MAG TPA: hypothetical protein V6C81_13365 [Planktothrix sp.]